MNSFVKALSDAIQIKGSSSLIVLSEIRRRRGERREGSVSPKTDKFSVKIKSIIFVYISGTGL